GTGHGKASHGGSGFWSYTSLAAILERVTCRTRPAPLAESGKAHVSPRTPPPLRCRSTGRRENSLNQTTQDWYRRALFEITTLLVTSCSRHHLEAAKVTNFVTWRCFTSPSDLTGCHRSVLMSCGLI